jgi:hypothetical protein
MKFEKIGKIMMIVFMASIFAVPVLALADGLTMPEASTVGYGETEIDFVVIVKKIVKWVVGFIVLIAIFMFAYGGLTYMTAGGDETKVDTAKKALTAALYGLLIAALAYAIVNLIISFATQ